MIWKLALTTLLMTGVASASGLDELSLAELEYAYSLQDPAAVDAVLVMEKNAKDAIDKAFVTLPDDCLAFPLPTTPTGPKWTSRWSKANGDHVDVTIWRKACSGSQSVVLVTLKPVSTNGPFICGTSTTFTATQGDVQATSTRFSDEPAGYRNICVNLQTPITGWLSVQMTPLFDHNKAFELHAREFPSQEISVPAYDPTKYNLTPPPLNITHEFSGSWYYSGYEVQNQGWFLEFNPEHQIAIAAWFTGDDTADHLKWYTSSGTFSGDVATMELWETKYVTFGGTTGVSKEVGTLKFTFTSCNRGLAEWEFEDGRKGSLPIDRMIPAPTGCHK